MAKISFVDRYCRRVRQFLICRPEIREHILNDLRCDLEEYVESHPEATEDQLIEKFGKPESYNGQLKSILSNENIFGIDLYKAGIGELIEEIFVKEIAGAGAVRATLKEYLA